MRSQNVDVFDVCSFHRAGDWVAVSSAEYKAHPERGYVFSDDEKEDWHLIRIRHPSYAGIIKLSAKIRPEKDCDTDFYINHWGGIDVCSISPDGKVMSRGIADNIICERNADGTLCIEAIFRNHHDSISVGTTHRVFGPLYRGKMRAQWRIFSLEVARDDFPKLEGIDKIVFVDVGARGYDHNFLLGYGSQVQHVLVEPEMEEAARLRNNGFHVIEAALSNVDGFADLYLTRNLGCSSLLEPNETVLSRYRVAPIFDVMAVTKVKTSRYDTLYQTGHAPAPHVLKIDVQGLEYQVLEGFGGLLQDICGIELEAHFYPIYKEQKTIGEIVDFLDRYGFSLRRLQEQDNFDSDRVEFNAWFIKRVEAGSAIEKKVKFIEDRWQIYRSDNGCSLVGIQP